MIAIDTNIIVRLLTGDDKEQLQQAVSLFESHEVFIPDTVILETEWVLRFAYKFTANAIGDAFNNLFGLPNVHTENPALIFQAIRWHRKGLDFADALHLVRCQHLDKLYTFDVKFIRKSTELSGCTVCSP